MKQTVCIVGSALGSSLARTIALASFMGLSLVACGQKGPLYLPPPTTTTTPAQAAPAADSAPVAPNANPQQTAR